MHTFSVLDVSCCTFVTSSLSELQVYTNMLQIIESKRISLLQQLQLQVTISRTTKKAEQWVTALKWTCVMIMCSGYEDSSYFLLGLYEKNKGHTDTFLQPMTCWEQQGASRQPEPRTSSTWLGSSTSCVNKNKNLCRLHVSGTEESIPWSSQTNRLKEALQSHVWADWTCSAAYRMLNNSRRLPVAAAHAHHSVLQPNLPDLSDIWQTSCSTSRTPEPPPGACSSKPPGSTDVPVDKDLHLDSFPLQSAAFSVAGCFIFLFNDSVISWHNHEVRSWFFLLNNHK